MTIYYVDPVSGSNVNSGTSSGTPFLDFAPLNAGLWNANEVRVKRGTTGIVSLTGRALIEAVGGCLLTAYGDPAAPKPIISGNGVTVAPIWARNGSGIVIEQMHATRSTGNGIAVTAPNSMSLTGTIVRDCLATFNSTNAAISETEGISIGGVMSLSPGVFTTDPGNVTNTLIQRCIANDNGGNGIKARGWVNGLRVLDSTALRNGRTVAGHGIGTSGVFLRLDPNYAPGHIHRISEGWTNISGNVWEHGANMNPVATNITAWQAVWVLGAGPTYYRLPFSSTPATPGPGECGIGAANTVRINLNGLVDPSTLSQMYCGLARPENCEFRNCVGAYTYVGPSGVEGQGIYFDSGSYKCYSYDCSGIENQGHGAFLNDPTESGHFGFYAYNNLAGGAFVARGVNTNMQGGTFICLPGTRGIQYSTGNVNGRARRNTIVGASVGIWSNGSTSNTVVEDENVFVDCAVRLTQISGPGARSIDRSGLLPLTHRRVNAAWGRIDQAAAAT